MNTFLDYTDHQVFLCLAAWERESEIKIDK